MWLVGAPVLPPRFRTALFGAATAPMAAHHEQHGERACQRHNQ